MRPHVWEIAIKFSLDIFVRNRWLYVELGRDKRLMS
jgi:hypothetical protein